MIDVEFRIGGRKITFDKGCDEMEAQVLTEAKKVYPTEASTRPMPRAWWCPSSRRCRGPLPG